MGIENIERLKRKFSIVTVDGFDKHLELIDNIYYEEKIFSEQLNKKEDIVTWFFDDGSRFRFNMGDVTCIFLFIRELSTDIDEQMGYGFKFKLKKYNTHLEDN